MLLEMLAKIQRRFRNVFILDKQRVALPSEGILMGFPTKRCSMQGGKNLSASPTNHQRGEWNCLDSMGRTSRWLSDRRRRASNAIAHQGR